jgi:hypothetical protein
MFRTNLQPACAMLRMTSRPLSAPFLGSPARNAAKQIPQNGVVLINPVNCDSERWSRSGSLHGDKGCRPFSRTPYSAGGLVPSLRFG